MLEKQSITWRTEDEDGEEGIGQIKSRVSSWPKKNVQILFIHVREI